MKIFVTYSRLSQPEVASLVKDLEELGHEVWFDKDISGGQSWWDNILNQIRNCEVYVFAIAKDSIDSTACIRELKYAEALGKAPLPVLIKNDVSLAIAPRYIANVQYVDYTKSDQKKAIIGLINSLNHITPTISLPDPLPEPPEIPISYLDTLKEKVDAPTITKNEQISLVKTLQSKLDDPQVDHKDIILLLRRLRRHDDLFFATAKDIDKLLQRTISDTQDKTEVSLTDETEKSNSKSSSSNSSNSSPTHNNVHHERTKVNKDSKQQQWNIGLVILLGLGTFCIPFIGIIAGIMAINTKENRTAGYFLLGLGVVVGFFWVLLLIGGIYEYDDSYYY